MISYNRFISATVKTLKARGSVKSKYATLDKLSGVYCLIKNYKPEKQFFSCPFKAVAHWHKINISKMRKENHWV